MGWKPIINTNGLALDEKLLWKLKNAGVYGFTFHIDTSQKRPKVTAAMDGLIMEQGAALMGERRSHSQKPEGFHEMIEKTFRGPALELFARGNARPGWYLWGNEVGKLD